MKSPRVIGGVLVVLGITLLVIGVNASNSIVDQTKELFTGRFTDATTWYLIGGIVSATAGILVLLGGRKGKG